MQSPRVVILQFNPERDDLTRGKSLSDGLSVAVQVGNTLWVANDETVSLERLSLVRAGRRRGVRYGRHHKQFPLEKYLRLPVPPPKNPANLEEVDVEGLAIEGGYLWLVGSHSLKRRQPKLRGAKRARRQLAQVRRDGNRYLLARIPLVASGGTYTLAKEATRNGKRLVAAQLHGDGQANDLIEAVRNDKHLKSFLGIPGKDNGLDIEGLAVVGKRLFLGLRGPVLRGWAMILEVRLEDDGDQSATLRLKAIGPKGRRYRKHFLQLGGLGIRDLCAQGSDLLILAGPTMGLDGPVNILRWRGGAAPDGESMVPASELKRVLDVPYGRGDDHAEGLTLFSWDGGKASSLLVVYDAASETRRLGVNQVAADVFRLPRASARSSSPVRSR